MHPLVALDVVTFPGATAYIPLDAAPSWSQGTVLRITAPDVEAGVTPAHAGAARICPAEAAPPEPGTAPGTACRHVPAPGAEPLELVVAPEVEGVHVQGLEGTTLVTASVVGLAVDGDTFDPPLPAEAVYVRDTRWTLAAVSRPGGGLLVDAEAPAGALALSVTVGLERALGPTSITSCLDAACATARPLLAAAASGAATTALLDLSAGAPFVGTDRDALVRLALEGWVLAAPPPDPDAQAEDAAGHAPSQGAGPDDGTGVARPSSPSREDSSAPPPRAESGPAPAPAPKAPTTSPGRGSPGVPEGTTLTTHRGDLVIREPGTVIDSLDVHGFVSVRAAGVVIRHTRVRGGPTSSPRGLVQVEPGASLTIEDSTLAADAPSPYVDGLRGAAITARRLDIHSVVDSLRVTGGDVRVEDSRLRDNAHFENDPTWGGGPSHDDSVQIQAGRRIVLERNVISGATSAAIMITQDLGTAADIRIVGNRIDGGACSVNISSNAASVRGLVITGNVFGRSTRHRDCAIIAPDGMQLDARGNTYTDGAGVRVRTG